MRSFMLTLLTENNMISNNEDRLLTYNQVAKMLNISEGTLRNRKSKEEDIPPYIQMGRLIRFKFSDVIEWLNSHKVVKGDE